MGLTGPYEEGLFDVINPVTFSATGKLLDEKLSDDDLWLIIVDSITAILPLKIQQMEDIESHTIGVKAQLESLFLLKYKAQMKISNKTVFFVTQKRTKISTNARIPSRRKSAVGNAAEFYFDIRIEMWMDQPLEKKVTTPSGPKTIKYGARVALQCFKNRGAQCNIPVVLPIIYGKGVSNVLMLADALQSAGLITQKGSYFVIDLPGMSDTVNVQGYKGLMTYIKENFDEVNKLVKDQDLVYFYKEEV
jgi:RecA/RadA recombinase